MPSLVTSLVLGLLLGMRHALEPDHLAAVSVLVTRGTKPWSGVIVGAVWGLGHTLALFVVGCLVAAIGVRLPARAAGTFELLVAGMLVGLGTRALLRAFASRAASPHRHPEAAWRFARQPFLVGTLHGLAGSGALSALAIAMLPGAVMRLIYIALFGAGSVVGMAFLSGVAGWPIGRFASTRRAHRWLSAVAGAISMLLGVVWGWAAVRGLIAA